MNNLPVSLDILVLLAAAALIIMATLVAFAKR